MDFQDVLQIIELIKSSSNFNELKLRSGDIEIELRRGGANPGMAPTDSSASAAVTAVAPPAQQNANGASPAAPVDTGPAPDVIAPPREPIAGSRHGMTVITAPMVGAVYHAAEPGATPFVKVGQRVEPGDPICIIEVMKLMNSINADCHGVVTEILVADGEAVEFGQDLFVISTC